MLDFSCLTISPIQPGNLDIALATNRAGGIAILDRVYCNDAEELFSASENLERLLNLIDKSVAIGLRLDIDQLSSSLDLLKKLQGHSHCLILCGLENQSLFEITKHLPDSTQTTLLIEITDTNQLSILEDSAISVQGLIAKGNECGGWVSDNSAFILAQKLLATQTLPVYVQGGIGVHTAAACRAVGAAGVVIEEQLWLMPESPFSPERKQMFRQLTGQETILLGEKLNAPCRILFRPTSKAAKDLQLYLEQIEFEKDKKSAFELWREKAHSVIGWKNQNENALPIGQSIGLAQHFTDKYKTTGRFIQSLLKESKKHLTFAQTHPVLQENNPLAVFHKTRYPIVQGPMTRVSDTAQFAKAVADGGALPMLALALMSREKALPLLRETQDLTWFAIVGRWNSGFCSAGPT